MSKPIKVMIVDDSALVRKAVSSILNAESDIQVAGMASDPYEAKDQIRTLAPDVIILDLEMPKMDGLTFLKLIMERRPCPVIIFSTLSTARSKYAIEAYKNGAFDVLGKPTNSKELTELAPQLLSMVRAAGQSKIQKNAAPVANPGEALNKLLQPQIDEQKLILIGASTGGTEAINTLLSQLPAKMPPIAIVQHIPEFFCAAFVDRLNGSSRLQVGMARHGEDFGPGQVRVSPGDQHLEIQFEGHRRVTRLNRGEKLHFQRPAVDVMFNSIKESKARQVIAVLLTGMGKDGAEGMLKLRQSGATTIVQNRETCVVYGMPREAELLGAVKFSLPLGEIAEKLVKLCASSGRSELEATSASLNLKSATT